MLTIACGDPPPSSSDTMAEALAETPAPQDFVPSPPGQDGVAPNRPRSAEPPETTDTPGGLRLLAQTEWTLSELFGQRVSAAGLPDPPRLEFDQADFRAWDGCNRLLGSFRQDGRQLSFTVSLATSDACPGAVADGQSFRSALERVRSWRLVGEMLTLFDPDDVLLARFDAR